MDPDTISSAARFYCSKVQTTDGATWYTGVELTTNSDNPVELADATCNLTITDGKRAWIGKGLNELSISNTIPDSMKHALESLLLYQKPTETYALSFTPQGNDLSIEIEWDNTRHGKDTIARLHFLLNPAPDNAEAVRELMKNVLQESASLRIEVAALTADCAAAGKSIQRDMKKLEDYGKIKEQKDGDLALKGAAVLVSKQEHLNTLLQQQS